MHKIPLVSIGLPVYNGERFLKETLNSILDQKFSDYEVIISDNDSTDKTEAICQEYISKDARIKYFKQKNNIGSLKNYNFVLQNAIGNYFMWQAADDLLANKEYLNSLIEKFTSNTDYVFPDVKIINSQGKIIRSNLMLPFQNAKTRFDFAKASIKSNSQLIYGLFKTSIIKEDFILLEKFRDLLCYGEGYFVHVVSTERKGKFVPEACKFYRRHDAMQSIALPASKLIPFYIQYAKSSLKYFYICRYFSVTQKFKLLLPMMIKFSRYIVYLLLVFVAQKFPTINSWRRKLIVYLTFKKKNN